METTAQAQADCITLEEAKRRFEHWRASRLKGRSRIPTELWQTAIDLVGRHTVNEVARALKLNHRELKSRHEVQHPPAARPATSPTPRFVELPWSAASGGVTDCVLEVEGREGRKLRVTVRDEGSGLDVLALAKGLWEATA